ncbi:TerB N-terminal domain-containing protein, partial [Leclercia adecarboxylata]|uniref:TerB N-terminal domain-containing protein n=1 Tax=Leclercia adecarboxylata TaxID=83655 RepID=UPI00234E32E8
LYFYGLERRLIIDNPSPDEETLLVVEVERLQAAYASDGSFKEYSAALLSAVELRRLSMTPGALEAWRPDLLKIDRSMPLALQVKLAHYALSGTRLDFEHAMAGMLSLSPSQGGFHLTSVTARTRKELIELVRRRFQERFPKGFQLRDRKDSKLSLAYRP